MSVSSRIARSGWLYRQSSILKKWKRYWFTLTTDGFLRYFESELSNKAEDVMNIPLECISIKMGAEVPVRKVQPPEGLRINFLLALETTNGRTWILCGDSEDEVKAWQVALQEARQIRQQPYRSPSCPPPTVAMYQTTAPYTVVVDDMSPRYCYPYRSYPYSTYSTTRVAYVTQPTMYYTGYPATATRYYY